MKGVPHLSFMSMFCCIPCFWCFEGRTVQICMHGIHAAHTCNHASLLCSESKALLQYLWNSGELSAPDAQQQMSFATSGGYVAPCCSLIAYLRRSKLSAKDLLM
jgi:hypothetical protein